MMRVLSLTLLLTLVACGVDGPPISPSQPQSGPVEPGLNISGEARIGVVTTL